LLSLNWNVSKKRYYEGLFITGVELNLFDVVNYNEHLRSDEQLENYITELEALNTKFSSLSELEAKVNDVTDLSSQEYKDLYAQHAKARMEYDHYYNLAARKSNNSQEYKNYLIEVKVD
jgi:hypothetical protein